MTLHLPAGDAWAKAQAPDDPTNWVLLSYVDGSKTDLTAVSGTGGLAEFCATLQDDAIHYGGFVVYGVDGRGNVTSRREKFVQVTWVGANVKVMAKSKVAGQRSKAMAYFSGYHIAYQIMDGDRDDISETELEKKLLQVGGAHTPEYYDFGSGTSESGGALKKRGGQADAVPSDAGQGDTPGIAAGADGGEKKEDGAVDAAEAALAAEVAATNGEAPPSMLVNEGGEQKAAGAVPVEALAESDAEVRALRAQVEEMGSPEAKNDGGAAASLAEERRLRLEAETEWAKDREVIEALRAELKQARKDLAGRDQEEGDNEISKAGTGLATANDEAYDGDESKDAAAAETTLSMFVETLVRSLVWRCSSHTAAPTRCSHAHL